MKKPLPIGISDFKELIDGGYAYIDKTLLIPEILEKGTKVALIPRMRRFGKTLNLSMLRYFFEKGEHDVSRLFGHLNVWKNNRCRALAGQFPVIFLTLKDVKEPSWQTTFESLRRVIAKEFLRHSYLLDSTLLAPTERKDFLALLECTADQTLSGQSLLFLTELLYRHHGKRVILLIDEYDTPAHEAYVGGYYDTFIKFLRNWLSAGLKDNIHLERGVLTGILRIAKESIFSGLNNISTFTVLNEAFRDKFGWVEEEVDQLLEEYGLQSAAPDMRQWYDGYRIGSTAGIYNPWSVLKCIDSGGQLAPYWVNTSENALMKQLITKGTGALKADVEELLRGGVIEKTIEEGLIFPELEIKSDAVWSLLLFSGYLTIDATPAYGTPCRLRIPNLEVTELYKSMILDWFKISIQEQNYQMLLNSLTSGDIDTFSQIFQEFISSSISAFDLPAEESEKSYHMFVLGMLIGLKGRYEVKSNRESGLGRYDVILLPRNPEDLGLIIEFKKVPSAKKMNLKAAAASALKQIEEKRYAQELFDRNVRRILYLGIAFEGKNLFIDHRFRK